MRFAPLLCVFFACGAFKAGLHTAVTETPVSASAAAMGACDALPFDRTYTYSELTDGQGKELGEGLKMCEFKWEFDTSIDAVGAGPGCDKPTGSVVIERVVLEYSSDEGVSQHFEVDCNLRLAFDSDQALTDSMNVANKCLTSLVSDKNDEVKKALSAKAKKIRIYTDASCAADACFTADWTIRSVVTGGLVAIGECPK